MRMNTRVVKIEKHPAGGHTVTLQRKPKGISRADSGTGLDQQAEQPMQEEDSTRSLFESM